MLKNKSLGIMIFLFGLLIFMFSFFSERNLINSIISSLFFVIVGIFIFFNKQEEKIEEINLSLRKKGDKNNGKK